MSAIHPYFTHSSGGGPSRTTRQLRLSYALLGLILVVDQLLLPMFHVGNFPYKVSYFLLGLWFGANLASDKTRLSIGARRDYAQFTMCISVIIACGLLGEIWFAAWHWTDSYNESIRSVLIYILIVLSFGLGLNSRKFELQWLIYMFFASIVLSFGFIFIRADMPSWLISIYYTERSVQAYEHIGISDVAGILDLVRPRGAFGNPNVSALLVNIVVLFIYVALRRRTLIVRNAIVGISIVVLPLLNATMLGSRSGVLFALILVLLNFHILYKTVDVKRRSHYVVIMTVALVLGIFILFFSNIGSRYVNNIDRVLALVDIVYDRGLGNDMSAALLERPFWTLERSLGRLKDSPLFGTGFSSSTRNPYPYNHMTSFFHNDWFRLAATSGIIGIFSMVWILVRFCLPLGWPILIPFVVPGLTNTFQLIIPAFIFYFFMVGVMREKSRVQSTSNQNAVG